MPTIVNLFVKLPKQQTFSPGAVKRSLGMALEALTFG